jgi:hypothetical protein
MGNRERVLSLQQRHYSPRGPEQIRSGGALHEDVHRAIAAESEAKWHLVVGAGVVVEQLRGAVPDHGYRDFANIRLEAATANAAGHRAIVGDEHLGSGPPVG